ncbi:Aprataxin and PNK-like factor, partial [Leptotrombidium deliense]
MSTYLLWRRLCSDKKVSRNHAVLELKDSGEITLTSIHVNPCFYSSDPESSPKILKKDKTQKLIAGDIFSLLPNSYRYQIVIKDEENDEDKQGHTNDVKADDSSCNGDTNKEENSEKYSEIKESKNQ